MTVMQGIVEILFIVAPIPLIWWLVATTLPKGF